MKIFEQDNSEKWNIINRNGDSLTYIHIDRSLEWKTQFFDRDNNTVEEFFPPNSIGGATLLKKLEKLDAQNVVLFSRQPAGEGYTAEYMLINKARMMREMLGRKEN